MNFNSFSINIRLLIVFFVMITLHLDVFVLIFSHIDFKCIVIGLKFFEDFLFYVKLVKSVLNNILKFKTAMT